MRRLLLTCGLAATCLSSGFASESNTETMVTETIKALRANDYAKAISSVQGSLDQARAAWDAYRALPGNPLEEAQVNQMLVAMTTPEMVETFVQQARATAPTNNTEEMAQGVAMLPLALMGITGGNPELASAPELQMVLGMLPDMQNWIKSLPIDDPDTAEKTVRAFAEGIQKLDIKSVDDLRALEFDALLAKASSLTSTLKEIGLTYDIDLDSFLDSINVSAGSDDVMIIKMTMFGKERELPVKMVEHEGMMVPKIIVDIQKAQEAPAMPPGFGDDMAPEEMP